MYVKNRNITSWHTGNAIFFCAWRQWPMTGEHGDVSACKKVYASNYYSFTCILIKTLTRQFSGWRIAPCFCYHSVRKHKIKKETRDEAFLFLYVKVLSSSYKSPFYRSRNLWMQSNTYNPDQMTLSIAHWNNNNNNNNNSNYYYYCSFSHASFSHANGGKNTQWLILTKYLHVSLCLFDFYYTLTVPLS